MTVAVSRLAVFLFTLGACTKRSLSSSGCTFDTKEKLLGTSFILQGSFVCFAIKLLLLPADLLEFGVSEGSTVVGRDKPLFLFFIKKLSNSFIIELCIMAIL